MQRTLAFVAIVAFGTACCLPPASAQPAAELPPSPQGKAAKSNAVREFTTPAAVRTVACSADGKLVAVANDGPALVLRTDGTSRVQDGWRPSADVLDAATGHSEYRMYTSN